MVLILSRVFCKKFHFIWDLMGSFFWGGRNIICIFIYLCFLRQLFGLKKNILWSWFATVVHVCHIQDGTCGNRPAVGRSVAEGAAGGGVSRLEQFNTSETSLIQHKICRRNDAQMSLIEKHSTLSGWCLIQVIEINELSGWDCRVSDSNEWQMILKIINWHMPSQGSHGIVKMFFPLQQWAFAASSRWNVKSMRKLLRTSNAHWLVMTSPTYPWLSGWMNVFILCGSNIIVLVVLLMEEILHQLGCKISCK